MYCALDSLFIDDVRQQYLLPQLNKPRRVIHSLRNPNGDRSTWRTSLHRLKEASIYRPTIREVAGFERSEVFVRHPAASGRRFDRRYPLKGFVIMYTRSSCGLSACVFQPDR